MAPARTCQSRDRTARRSAVPLGLRWKLAGGRAADLLRELGDPAPELIFRACRVVAALQILEAILQYGDETLERMLHIKPGSYINLLNGLCSLTNSDLKAQKQAQRTKREARS